MEKLMKLKAVILDELGAIADKSNLTPQELENAMKSVCLLREIEEYIGGEPNSDYGYSSSMGKGNYWGEYSTARMRNPMNGRYISSQDSMYGSRGQASYDSNYSGHSEDDLIRDLEMKLEHARTDRERQSIMDTIDIIRSNKRS
ncbi:MAG: hypothetical protein KBT27_03465 [Prevotellaceae bacterium]|nr:hypothetical protein [Candidatus Faecinaster equi]